MRSDEAARLLGISYDDPAQELHQYLDNLNKSAPGEDADINTIVSAREKWAREFEQMLNSQDEPQSLPEHEPSATPVRPEFRPAGPGDLNHSFSEYNN